MEAMGEILVLPFFGQGHLFPCMELCKHLSSYNHKAILIIPSHLSSSVPSSFRGLSLVEVVEIPNSPSSSSSPPPPPLLPDMLDGSKPGPGFGPGPGPFHQLHQKMGSGLEAFLRRKCNDSGQTRLACAVLDVMMSWSQEVFVKFGVPTVSFFTSGACSSAMGYASWKANVGDMKPGEIRKLDGLPEEMEMSYSDVKRQERHRPHRHGDNLTAPQMDGPTGPPPGFEFGRPNGVNGPNVGLRFGPPGQGNRPRWLDEVEGSTAMLFNTCDDLEHLFIKYIAQKIDKPVYGIGPLLPEQYWKSTGSILHDGQVRSNRKSNYAEDQVVQWLNSKPAQSVIYVSFGSEVGPTLEEYDELANALMELNRLFIWVIRPGSGRPGPPPGLLGEESGLQTTEEGYYPHGLEEKVGNRGLIITGWAPQLLILSHPALGGFLSHCGWNSTVESIGRGVPILAWPIRGDQFHNAKLVVNHLKVGHTLLTGDDPTQRVKKDIIIRGIDHLLDDKEVHKQAAALRCKFEDGFPASSVAALKSFIEAIVQKNYTDC